MLRTTQEFTKALQGARLPWSDKREGISREEYAAAYGADALMREDAKGDARIEMLKWALDGNLSEHVSPECFGLVYSFDPALFERTGRAPLFFYNAIPEADYWAEALAGGLYGNEADMQRVQVVTRRATSPAAYEKWLVKQQLVADDTVLVADGGRLVLQRTAMGLPA